MPKSTMDCRVAGRLGAALALWLGATAGCAGGGELTYLDGPVTMLEWDERTIQAQYVDADGLPVQATTCRFRTVGETHGAELTSHVAVTDARGVCRIGVKSKAAAAFQVIVDADGAKERISLPINVSRDAGGMVEVTIQDTAAAGVTSATVILVKDFDCALLNPWQPPDADGDAYNTRQAVAIDSGAGSTAKIMGLTADQAYTIVVVGLADDQIRAKGCRSNVVVDEQQILRKRVSPISLFLEDILPPDPGKNVLKVQSQFRNEVGLRGVAGLLRQLSDGDNDPVDYVLAKMEAEADSVVDQLIVAYGPEFVRRMSTSRTASGRNTLAEVATALDSVDNIQLHTLMRINDEDDEAEGQAQGNLTIDHKFSHFTAEISGVTDRFTVPRGQDIFGSTVTPKLRDSARIKIDDAEHLRISGHTMSVPIADAIIGKTLMNAFGSYHIDQIITTMVDCTRVGQWASQAIGSGSSLLDVPVRLIVNELCRNQVEATVNQIYQQIKTDLQQYRADQQLRFQGSAAMKLLPDGHSIDRLTNGDWTELGSFTARRQ